MTTPPNLSPNWIREINPELKKLDSIPLTGAPSFPWEEFSSRLAQIFDRKDLTIKPGEIAWRSKENLYEGLGDAPIPLIFSIPTLRGQVCWVMPTQEIDILTALLLTKDPHPLTFHDRDLSESFYHFLALEVLYNLTQVSFDKSLSPILTNHSSLPNQDSLCKDISIFLNDQTIWGRLIISPEFRQSWVEHFAQKPQPPEQALKMAQLVDVTLHLEAGKSHITLKELKDLKLGDFILLDSCTLDFKRLSGRIMLTVNGKQAFRAKLKDGTLKILELPLLHEVDVPMVKEPEDEEQDENDLSDLDDLSEDTWEDENEEEDFIYDENNDEELSADESAFETPTQVEEEEPAAAAAPLPEKPGPITPEQIPLTLIVEVGQIQMTVEQLLKLEPGNLLEIDIHPENGVNLTINGKVIGKGELIQIGEAMGVRILELG